MTAKRMETKPDKEMIPQVGVKNVPSNVIEKLQVIANVEGVSFNQLYILAFSKFIEVYEAKNGKVKVKPKGKGLEGI